MFAPSAVEVIGPVQVATMVPSAPYLEHPKRSMSGFFPPRFVE